MRQEERWFISYRFIECDFLTQKIQTMFNGSIVTNVTPARWICEHGKDHHIQYAERISPALASELIHGGAGISAEYFDADY